MAVISTVYIPARVAQMLGEDEDWLWEISCEMEPKDGCISVLGPNNEHIVAFTEEGIEQFRHLAVHDKAYPEELLPPLDG
jgi:hypothetical protein